MADRIYNRGKAILADASLDWESDTIKALLVDSSYTYDPTHNVVDDITGELTDGSYARVTLTNKSVVEDDTGNRAVLKGDPLDFGALANESPKAVILFKEGNDDSDSPLISYHDSGFGATANGAGYVVNGGGDDKSEWIVLEDPT